MNLNRTKPRFSKQILLVRWALRHIEVPLYIAILWKKSDTNTVIPAVSDNPKINWSVTKPGLHKIHQEIKILLTVKSLLSFIRYPICLGASELTMKIYRQRNIIRNTCHPHSAHCCHCCHCWNARALRITRLLSHSRGWIRRRVFPLTISLNECFSCD